MSFHWVRFGLRFDMTDDEVKQHVRKLRLEHHPDRGGDAELSAQVNEAIDDFMLWKRRLDGPSHARPGSFSSSSSNLAPDELQMTEDELRSKLQREERESQARIARMVAEDDRREKEALASKVVHICPFIDGEYHDLLLDRLKALRPYAVVHSMRMYGKLTPVTSRPKLVFGIGRDGAYGLYNWGQIKECFTLIAEAPDFIVELLNKVRAMSPELADLNHAIVTFADDGSSGIPPHQDKAFSLESSGPIEDASTLALMNMGATRKFMLSKIEAKATHYTERTLQASGALVRAIPFGSGELLLMPGEVNSALKHSVELTTRIKVPRYSIVFRKVDKEYICVDPTIAGIQLQPTLPDHLCGALQPPSPSASVEQPSSSHSTPSTPTSSTSTNSKAKAKAKAKQPTLEKFTFPTAEGIRALFSPRRSESSASSVGSSNTMDHGDRAVDEHGNEAVQAEAVPEPVEPDDFCGSSNPDEFSNAANPDECDDDLREGSANAAAVPEDNVDASPTEVSDGNTVDMWLTSS